MLLVVGSLTLLVVIVSTAILVDYDGQKFDNITAAPIKSISVHGLLNF